MNILYNPKYAIITLLAVVYDDIFLTVYVSFSFKVVEIESKIHYSGALEFLKLK